MTEVFINHVERLVASLEQVDYFSNLRIMMLFSYFPVRRKVQSSPRQNQCISG